jgi:hypothetical protein
MATSILARFAFISCLFLAACGGGDPEDIEEPAREPIPGVCEVEPRPTACL